MWILETQVHEHKYWVQVKKDKDPFPTGLKDNAVAYPDYYQAMGALRDYQRHFFTDLKIVRHRG